MKNKIESIVARLGRFCSEDSDGVLQGDDEREQWAKLLQ